MDAATRQQRYYDTAAEVANAEIAKLREAFAAEGIVFKGENFNAEHYQRSGWFWMQRGSDSARFVVRIYWTNGAGQYSRYFAPKTLRFEYTENYYHRRRFVGAAKAVATLLEEFTEFEEAEVRREQRGARHNKREAEVEELNNRISEEWEIESDGSEDFKITGLTREKLEELINSGLL